MKTGNHYIMREQVENIIPSIMEYSVPVYTGMIGCRVGESLLGTGMS